MKKFFVFMYLFSIFSFSKGFTIRTGMEYALLNQNNVGKLTSNEIDKLKPYSVYIIKSNRKVELYLNEKGDLTIGDLVGLVKKISKNDYENTIANHIEKGLNIKSRYIFHTVSLDYTIPVVKFNDKISLIFVPAVELRHGKRLFLKEDKLFCNLVSHDIFKDFLGEDKDFPLKLITSIDEKTINFTIAPMLQFELKQDILLKLGIKTGLGYNLEKINAKLKNTYQDKLIVIIQDKSHQLVVPYSFNLGFDIKNIALNFEIGGNFIYENIKYKNSKYNKSNYFKTGLSLGYKF